MNLPGSVFRTAVSLCAFWAISCAGRGDGITLGSSMTPTGTLAGQLYTVDLEPIEGATLTLSMPGEETSQIQTDAEGFFRIEGVPSSSDVLIGIQKDGYISHTVTARVTAQAAGVPISNATALVGPYSLIRNTGEIRIRVFSATGRPAKGAKLQLHTLPAAGFAHPAYLLSFRHGYPIGQHTASAEANAEGIATFQNIPHPEDVNKVWNSFVNYIVSVSGFDENNDGVPDSAGQTQFYSSQSFVLDNTPRFIKLTSVSSSVAFTVRNSNVQSILPGGAPGSVERRPTENMIRSGESIQVAYTHPLNAYSVRITDETGTQAVAVTQTLSAGGTLLTITPSAALTAGQEYNLAIHAVSAETGAVSDVLGYFFSGVPGTAPAFGFSKVAFFDTVTANGQLSPGEVVNAHFTVPATLFGTVGPTGPSIAYFNRDLNSSGIIGDAVGERGFSGLGFEIRPNEPVSETGTLFGLLGSGYTTRWSILYTGAATIPATTPVDIDFSQLKNVGIGIQTAWGQLLTQSASANLTVSP